MIDIHEQQIALDLKCPEADVSAGDYRNCSANIAFIEVAGAKPIDPLSYDALATGASVAQKFMGLRAPSV